LLEYKLAKIEKEGKSKEKSMWKIGKVGQSVKASVEYRRPKSIDNTPVVGDTQRHQSFSMPRIMKKITHR
jgi:hypothetical protein